MNEVNSFTLRRDKNVHIIIAFAVTQCSINTEYTSVFVIEHCDVSNEMARNRILFVLSILFSIIRIQTNPKKQETTK